MGMGARLGGGLTARVCYDRLWGHRQVHVALSSLNISYLPGEKACRGDSGNSQESSEPSLGVLEGCLEEVHQSQRRLETARGGERHCTSPPPPATLA